MDIIRVLQRTRRVGHFQVLLVNEQTIDLERDIATKAVKVVSHQIVDAVIGRIREYIAVEKIDRPVDRETYRGNLLLRSFHVINF